MSGKKTLIIALIFIIAVGGYLWDQRRRESSQEREVAESRLLKPNGQDLTGLTLKHLTQDRQTIRLVKEDKLWKLTEPIRTRADKATIESLLSQLDSAKKDNPFTPEKGKLGDYGLEKPVMTVAFSTGKDATPPDLALGDKTPDNNAVYARLADRDEVFTVDAGLVRSLGNTPLQLRDKRLLPAALTEATTVTLAHDGGTVQLEKREGQWKLEAPIRKDADPNTVSDILSQCNNAKVANFIDSPTLHLAEAGLDQPHVRASFYVNGDDGLKTYTMLIGDRTTTAVTPTVMRFARQDGEPALFAVNDDLAKKLRPTLDELRSKQLFAAPSADVGRIDLRLIRNSFRLNEDKDKVWRFDDDPEAALDQNTVNQKLAALVGLQAVRFFNSDLPTSTTGLDSPNVTVTVWTKDRKTSETLETGRKADDGDWVYCRFTGTDGQSQLIGVDQTRPGEFFLTRDDLLDKTIFHFAVEDAHKATIEDGKTSLTLTRTAGGAWNGLRTEDGKPVGEAFTIEPNAMNNLLYAVVGMEWKRRLSPTRDLDRKDLQQFELDRPARRLTFFDDKGAVLATLGLGGFDSNDLFVTGGPGQDYAIPKFRTGSFTDAVKQLFTKAGAPLQPLKGEESPGPMGTMGAMPPSPPAGF